MNIINAIKTACVGIALVTQGNATRQTNPQLQTPIFETTKKIIDGALEFTSFTDMGTCLSQMPNTVKLLEQMLAARFSHVHHKIKGGRRIKRMLCKKSARSLRRFKRENNRKYQWG